MVTDVRSDRTHNYLHGFHQRHPGSTSRSLERGVLASTLENSYQALACRTIMRLKPGSDGSVVDLGCGDGLLLQKLAVISDRPLIGVDFAEAELELARQRVPQARLIETNADCLPLPNDSVDALVCHMAFMLFPDQRKVLHELRRVLAPGAAAHLVVGGRDRTGRFAAYVDALRDAVRQSGVALVPLGDPTVDSIPALISQVVGLEEATLEHWELRFECDDADDWEALRWSYDVDQLSPEITETLRRTVFGSRGPRSVMLTFPLEYHCIVRSA